MCLAPRLKDGIDPLLVSIEFGMREDRRFYVLGLYERIAVTGSTVGFKQGVTECGKNRPIGVECVDVGVGDTAVEVCAEVVEVFGFRGIDIARDIEVIVVGGIGDFGYWHHTRVAR